MPDMYFLLFSNFVGNVITIFKVTVCFYWWPITRSSRRQSERGLKGEEGFQSNSKTLSCPVHMYILHMNV